MRKIPLALALVAGIALSTTACSAQPATRSATTADDASVSTAPVSISLESYMPSLGQVGVTTINQLLDGFHKENPNITVKLISDTQAGAATMAANYQREAATDSLPDVGQIVFDTARFAVDSLGAQPLDTIYGKDELNALFGGQYPYAKAVTKLGVVGKHTYGVPWTLSTPVLFYNPNLFTQAGITTPPTTWAELATDAAKIKAATGAGGLANGCIGTANGGNDWCLQSMLASNGGSVMNAAATKTSFDSAANIDVMTQMQKMQKQGSLVDLTTQQMVQQFSTGKIAMVLNTAALQTTLLNGIGGAFSLKNTGMPGFGTKTLKPTNSGSALVVFSKDKAKQAAALTLVKYLTAPAAMTRITEQVGYPPLRPGLANADKYLKPFATQHPLLAVNLAQLEKIVPWRAYPGNNFIQVETLITDASTKIIFQGQNAKTVLTAAQSQATELVK